MTKLLEKSYNCYMSFLGKLSKGRTDQDYCLLYDSILCLKNNIIEPQYTQYFESNLNCKKVYPLI